MNNEVIISGTVTKDIEFNHSTEIEDFYKLYIGVNRLSGTFDEIPIIISNRFIDTNKSYLGKKMRVEGDYRSYNMHTEDGTHLILNVFAQNISNNEKQDENLIAITGTLCKNVVYRMTPFGRKIADVLLAVNRLYNKADYIPCIAWGRDAHYLRDNYKKGDKIAIIGRIQSRKYTKDNEEKIAYEVSISSIKKVIAN